MLFAAPLFLIALIPWLGVVLWLLLGRRERVNVPFLELWKGPVRGPMPKRRMGMPPIALAALLAAMLLGILAAARPGMRGAGGSNQKPLTIVVDRGMTMSMGVVPRYEVAAEEIKAAVRDEFRGAQVRLVLVPGGELKRNVEDWVIAVKGSDATALDTREELQRVVKSAQRPLIVITDQAIDNERAVKAAPTRAVKNVSIAHVAGRISPIPQVMVRVRNQSDAKRAVIRLGDARQEVELPASGEARDYFMPVEAGATGVRVEVEVLDDFAADNVAYLVKRGSWPKVEVRTPISAELQRLVDQYSRLRPAGDESKRIGLGEGDSEIVLAKLGAGVSGAVTVAAHPITAALERVDWQAMTAGGAGELPAGDWKLLVRVGERAILAAREAPNRQVWVGFDTRLMASQPEFVVMWSAIFDWVGEGGEEFAARTTGRMEKGWGLIDGSLGNREPGWWPALYRRADGVMVGVNAPDVILPEVAGNSGWRTEIAELAREYRNGGGVTWLTTWLILGAMGLMLVAAMTWRGGLKYAHASTRGHGSQVRAAVD